MDDERGSRPLHDEAGLAGTTEEYGGGWSSSMAEVDATLGSGDMLTKLELVEPGYSGFEAIVVRTCRRFCCFSHTISRRRTDAEVCDGLTFN